MGGGNRNPLNVVARRDAMSVWRCEALMGTQERSRVQAETRRAERVCERVRVKGTE